MFIGPCYVPDIILSTLHASVYLLLTTTLCNRHYFFPHFVDGKTEVRNREAACVGHATIDAPGDI